MLVANIKKRKATKTSEKTRIRLKLKFKKLLFVVVVDQFLHLIAAYELFVLFFSSVLNSRTLSHVATLRMILIPLIFFEKLILGKQTFVFFRLSVFDDPEIIDFSKLFKFCTK